MGYMSVAAAMPLIKAGRLRPVAVTSKARVPALPDGPTLSETPALASYELDNWFGLFAPAAVPKGILATLNAAAVKAIGTPELQKTIIDGGAIPAPGTPEAFAAFIAAQSQLYAQIIKEVGITADS
jgi:tripartite-type tricarboxylate transporter receptor subunit TctC